MENLAEELNVIKKDWRRKIKLSFALIYPNIYSVGMSSYSIHLLYSILNSREDVACERFFLPQRVKYPASQDTSLNPNHIVSIENGIPLKEFDILGFSIQFENDYRNVLWILDAAGIPIRINERKVREKNLNEIYPKIIAGGPCATSNSMVLSEYIDYFFIGDVESNINDFLDLAIESKDNSGNLNFDLTKLIKINGIFIPSIQNECTRAVLNNLDDSESPLQQTRPIFKKKSVVKLAFGDTFLLEINRGCPFSCKFCISSHHNAPFRNKTYGNIINTIDQAIQLQNIKKITFIGSSVSSHPKFTDICKYVVEKNINIMIPSIRIDQFSNELIKVLERGNIRTITIAPETGYDKLRATIGKKISNEQIIKAAKTIRDSKIRNIKLYFLIGLPGEGEEDIDKIIGLVAGISDLGFDKNALRVNINPFIPKLNTPYQIYTKYFTKDNFNTLKRHYEKIQKGFSKLPAVKMKFKNIKILLNNAMIQTIFSLGDIEVSKMLGDYYNDGATYVALKKAATNRGFSIDEYFKRIMEGYNPLPPSCLI